jgi:Fur family ferric uptake transcriptional regulator
MERSTKQRHAIRDALAEASRPLSPREILDAAQANVEKLGMATVYRTLKGMVADRSVVVVELPGEAARFELAGKGHHHHFHCTRCKKVFEVEGCPGDLAHLTPAGFLLEGHELTLIGRCAACAKPARPGPEKPHAAKPSRSRHTH